MMAYNSGFVASIIKDGKVFRESAENGTRTVRLPFGSEYKIRLQNKNNVRAYARVLIDGTEIHTGKFILQPHSSFDLERFMLDNDMGSGKKLKFVSAGHGDVQDPTAKENGLVEVIFEKEIISWLTFTNNTGNITLDSFGRGGVLRGASGATFKSTANSLEGAAYAVNSNSSAGATANTTLTTTGLNINPAPVVASDLGATVEGGQSNQKFQESCESFAVEYPTSIKIQLRGQKEKKPWSFKNVPEGFVVTCGENKLGFIEEVSINPTHLVIKIPISQVQIGS
jgi:hypothetical protein